MTGRRERSIKDRLAQLFEAGEYLRVVKMRAAALSEYPDDEEVAKIIAFSLSMPEIDRTKEAISFVI